MRCADLGQAAALALDGVPGPDDGLAAITVEGAPHPDEWPAALFVYGTLQPGQPAWPLLAAHAVGRPRRATVAGRVRDTGRGYPALLPGGPARRAADGSITVRDPAVAAPPSRPLRGLATTGASGSAARTATRGHRLLDVRLGRGRGGQLTGRCQTAGQP